jgi:hypothetical protein
MLPTAGPRPPPPQSSRGLRPPCPGASRACVSTCARACVRVRVRVRGERVTANQAARQRARQAGTQHALWPDKHAALWRAPGADALGGGIAPHTIALPSARALASARARSGVTTQHRRPGRRAYMMQAPPALSPSLPA